MCRKAKKENYENKFNCKPAKIKKTKFSKAPRSICDKFNQYFATVGSQIKESFSQKRNSCKQKADFFVSEKNEVKLKYLTL